MLRARLVSLVFFLIASFALPVAAQDGDDDDDARSEAELAEESRIEEDGDGDDDGDDTRPDDAIAEDSRLEDEDEKPDDDRVIESRSTSDGDCICPREGEWKVQNLEGWMNCTGPMNIKRKIGEVKDEGTIWILEEDCSSIFGEASRKKDEDVLMERGESCGFQGTINGEENGVTMSIDVKWTFENNEFLTGEMHSEPSLQGMMCEYYRPFEIRFEDEILEKDYDKRREKMLKKLEKVRGD